ncbi:MAG: YfhO family protein, partial [bacterium]|nr:YfhO family protein [bacterium]
YFGEIPSSDWLKKPSTISLFKDQEPFRIWSVTQYGQSPYQALGWQKDQEALLSIRQALPPNSNLLFNLDSFSDRGWFEGGLSPRKRNRLERFLLDENQNEITMAKLLGMFNVRYILTFAERGGFEMTEKVKVDLGREFGMPLRVFENGENMPRWYFVPEAKVIPDEEALLTAMADQKFLPIRTVLLEKEPRQVPPSFSGSLDDFKKDNPLTLQKYGATEVLINAQIKDHGFLVLSDLFYPGWKVQVDNQEKEILPANYLVRAVELTPGQHEVRFYYDPFPFKIGAIISLSAVVFLLLLVLSQLKSLKKLKFFKQ